MKEELIRWRFCPIFELFAVVGEFCVDCNFWRFEETEYKKPIVVLSKQVKEL